MTPPAKILWIPTIFWVSIIFFSSCCVSDEVVIERNATKVGDFDCSNCASQVSSKLDLLNGDMTAGDLWRKFNRHGINSVERLTFYVALEQIDDSEGFELAPVEFKIDDLTASLDGKTLIATNYGTSTSIPMAKLELLLPYDFMEKYSADSKVPIEFTSSDGDEAASPNVSMKFDSGIWKSQIALAGFAVFWIVVFILFNRLTKPAVGNSDGGSSLQSSSNRQALSA